jgi:23S rRNA-/tRNA-specific pseudouridylate synthase
MVAQFKVIYEDQHLIVIDKAAGLLSQGAYDNETNLVDLLRAYFGRHYVGLVHRLDRNTSGLMVVAKRSKAAQRLTDSLQGQQLQRDYLAWLEGDFFDKQGLAPTILAQNIKWSDLILRDENELVTLCQPQSQRSSFQPNQAKDQLNKRIPKHQSPQGLGHHQPYPMTAHQFPPHPHAHLRQADQQISQNQQLKEAHLEVSCVRQAKYHGKVISLCVFKLQTGRTHQIRAQASHRGLPLLGDQKYGAQLGFHRTALHSYFIKFPHPMTHDILSFELELPVELQF